jgi:uncharacterized protein (TIGR03083 family)
MLTRQEIQTGYPAELLAFAELLRSLGPDDLPVPTRCTGWTVADVGAHVTGGLADVLSGRLEGSGLPAWTDRQVAERRGRTGAELADELEGYAKVGADVLASFDEEAWNGPAPAGVAGTLGAGVEGLWYDVYVHADDIRSALGRPSVPGPGLRCSAHHLADLLAARGWGPATVALDGMEELTIGAGGGPRITGDPLTFVLVACGRQDPAVLGLDASVNVYGT